MPKFTASLNLPKYVTAPASPADGDVYYNTTDNKVYSRINGAWVDLAAGGSGATVYYQTTAPATANDGDIWFDSDDEVIGSTGATGATGAAGASGVSESAFRAYEFGDANVIGTFPRWILTTTAAGTLGTIFHTRLIPTSNFTVSNISFSSTGAATSPTLIRFGIYTRSGTTFTLVARTDSDTTIFNATNSKFTRALSTTGGYPATYNMTAGTEYWISSIQVGTGGASILAPSNRWTNSANASTGAQQYTQASQTDLVASSTATAQPAVTGHYAEVS